jgi:hypothetical protein|tara:strand:- start:3027 stop:3242 length:216 start_codon:yes stop_codon:yes gene_type:complete
MAGGGAADHTMTVDSAISMRNEELSNRSGSSDGSLNKRGIKSNVALQNKHLQMKTAQGKFAYIFLFLQRKI